MTRNPLAVPGSHDKTRTDTQKPVNKSDTRATFVNRLSALQLTILTELAASQPRPHPFTGERVHGQSILSLRRIFGLPWPRRRGDAQPTASQRASLIRSLRRLEQAGFIDRPCSPYGVAITRTGRAALRMIQRSRERR